MEEIAEKIVLITNDYHSDYDNGFVMSSQHVIEWVNQFDADDREFVLNEVLHILKQGVYISKQKAKEILLEFINKATTYFDYQNIETFLRETHFISIQGAEKSQTVLLSILNEILIQNTGFSLDICGTLGIRNYIYLDDVIGSGGKFNFEIHKYISENNLLNALKNKEIKILSYFFCIHTWGAVNARYILKNRFTEENFFLDYKAFPIKTHYTVENNIKEFNQRLNLIYPVKSKNDYDVYLTGLDQATKQADRAYRKQSQPNQETFFSSKTNRLRLEHIFLDKGIEIINQIQDPESKRKHRPLGKTYPGYKTFGTGTLFFTWRNVSNTCPIVFWWDNVTHNWKGLFPLHNRGN
ncbi:hypothetical protein NAT51_10875 [Flavobacterium amniphilum]|uniref:phosphoribosyltransferase-like protein n=1 Tax=Flavobacterium amniphilum TaxID=1834035 RepID=UPI00202A5716|nr:hypothetical protein [Flavobacterium amniphilum]MCL9806030.1 hypothetical protein [Flavobacterium amniphilum]